MRYETNIFKELAVAVKFHANRIEILQDVMITSVTIAFLDEFFIISMQDNYGD